MRANWHDSQVKLLYSRNVFFKPWWIHLRVLQFSYVRGKSTAFWLLLLPLSHSPLIMATTERNLAPCGTQRTDACLKSIPTICAEFLVREGVAFISTSSPSRRRHNRTHMLCADHAVTAREHHWLLFLIHIVCRCCVFVIVYLFLPHILHGCTTAMPFQIIWLSFAKSI